MTLSNLVHGMELRRGDRVKSTVKDNGLTYLVKSKHRDGTVTVKVEGLPCAGGGDLYRCSPESLRRVCDPPMGPGPDWSPTHNQIIPIADPKA
jgi:hypothetical protein